MKTLTTAAMLALVAGGPALAAGMDQPVAEPTVQPAPVSPAPVAPASNWSGFYAGGQLGYGELTADPELPDDMNGAIYGLHAGYMHDFGSIVAGAELDYDQTQLESDATGLALDSVARAKLRIGYDAGNLLPYLTAGVAQATTSGALDAEDQGNFAGIGAEYKVTDRIRVGGEILRHQFEDFDNSGIDVDATTGTARISFQF